MTTTRRFPAVKAALALALACLCCACLLPAAAALAAEAAIDYQKESLTEYEKQLASGQIASVTVNKLRRSVRVRLKDGRYVLARYEKHHEPTVLASLKAKGVPVTVLTPSAAQQEAKSTHKVHHKLRYIVGGIVIVVILIVGAVLLIARRRRIAAE